jgi:molybdenum-dependent DNA-binding transcriptional regulator ModE
VAYRIDPGSTDKPDKARYTVKNILTVKGVMMINLQRTQMFVAVADTGSFTAAAEAMGLTKAVVSFNIRQLEDELGVTLLLRSTRRLTLTEAGALFHQRSVALLKDAERLQDDVRANHAGSLANCGSRPRLSMAHRSWCRCWPGLASSTRIFACGMFRRHCTPTLSRSALTWPSGWERLPIRATTPR